MKLNHTGESHLKLSVVQMLKSECALASFYAVKTTQKDRDETLRSPKSDAYNCKLAYFSTSLFELHTSSCFFPNSCAEKCCLQPPNPAQSGP